MTYYTYQSNWKHNSPYSIESDWYWLILMIVFGCLVLASDSLHSSDRLRIDQLIRGGGSAYDDASNIGRRLLIEMDRLTLICWFKRSFVLYLGLLDLGWFLDPRVAPLRRIRFWVGIGLRGSTYNGTWPGFCDHLFLPTGGDCCFDRRVAFYEIILQLRSRHDAYYGNPVFF